MSPFLLRLNSRSTAYRSALNEMTQLAVTRGGKPTGLSETLVRLAGDLRHSRASRLQLILADPFLRTDVEQELRRLGPKPPRVFFKEIQGNPKAVMRLPGYFRVRSRIVQSVQSDAATFNSLFEVMMAYLKRAHQDQQTNIEYFSRKGEALKRKANEIAGLAESSLEYLIAVAAGLLIEDVETGKEAVEAAEEAINQVATCLAEAANRLTVCKSQCAAGSLGEFCRLACDAAYLLDIANCVTA